MVTKLNAAGNAIYGMRFLFAFDELMKSISDLVPGVVSKTLSKVLGAVLLSHVAILCQLKYIMKVSDADIAKCSLCYSVAYTGYHIWARIQGHTKTLEGLAVTLFLGLLNLYVGYA
jgi:hypothetical protein